MRVDWIPKGPPTGTLTIKPKDRCPPKFVSKIEGSAVEESCRFFFEGIVDAQPQPKFSWYFNDELIIPGQKGFEEAEIHDSRKMSTLILKYVREHHMGKYTLQATNQLGTVECNCDLIVRKKQFPPVFWQRLYNVSGEKDSTRYVGGVEVGGWPVPVVYWYKVMDDGTEEEVTTKTHTENWNGNPNKYVPSSRVEIRQIDQIRHCIIFQQVSEGDSGLYRVRAVNCLGEAECEAELSFDGLGGEGATELYLPPLWREKRRLTWKDEDQRKKPFVGYKEPELSPEDIANMKNKSGLKPLSRITEHLASLPDYVPSGKFNNMDRMPFKAGVDEHDYRPDRKGGKPGWPSKFEKGSITHRGYNTDASGRILPLWYNKIDPKARDSSDWRWRPVNPDLYVPNIPPEQDSPDPPPVWESIEDIQRLVEWLRSMGCMVEHVKEIGQAEKKYDIANSTASRLEANSFSQLDEKRQNQSRVISHQSSAITEHQHQKMEVEHLAKTKDVKKMWEERLDKSAAGAQENAADFTAQFLKPVYQKKDNLSFPELEKMSQPPPALPPKTKIMHSPSRHLFSPTESLDSNNTVTASVKTVEFIPVKEKVKLIAAQQEELNKREEATAAQGADNVKHKGVRILPPSPVTVRKMSVEDELHSYDTVVSRTTPVTQMMETSQSNSFVEQQQQTMHSFQEEAKQHVQRTEVLQNSSAKYNVDQAFEQLIAETEELASNEELLLSSSSMHQTSHVMQQSYQQSSQSMHQTSITTQSIEQSESGNLKYLSPAEECRRSFEEAELEAMAVESQSSKTFSKQSSMVETGSVQSFVYQEGSVNTFQTSSHFQTDMSEANNMTNKQIKSSSSSNIQNSTTKQASDAETYSQARKPLRSTSFVRTPDTFTTAQSAPTTPMSQRRRLRINQSPKPIESDSKPKYREQLSERDSRPGFYRPPAENSSSAPMFQLMRRSNSKTNFAMKNEAESTVRVSQASSQAYEADSES